MEKESKNVDKIKAIRVIAAKRNTEHDRISYAPMNILHLLVDSKTGLYMLYIAAGLVMHEI